jgi:hypothetical protein
LEKLLAFLAQSTANCKNWTLTFISKQNANKYRRKLAEIAENGDF